MSAAFPFARELGWVLLHSLWQGALVGLFAALALRAARRASAEARYAIACAGMLALAAAPVATLAFWPTPSATTAAAIEAPNVFTAREAPLDFDPLLELAAALWLAGALVAQARLALHALRAERLRREGLAPAPAELERALRELCRELDVRSRVRVATSTRASVPAVVGCFAPIVLVPACALSGLSPSELRAVLAHELAHVRRHDALANLLQAFFEALFFFHPAAWWLSMRARVEREYCCDDLAVRASGDALGFARALAQLETLRGEPAALALASTGGPLMQRIQRLVAPHEAPRGRATFRGLATAAAAALLGTSALALAPAAQWRRAAPEGEGSARQESPEELEARIHDLRARIRDLEQRIDALREERRAEGGESLPPVRRREAVPEEPRMRRRFAAPPDAGVPAPEAPRGGAGLWRTPGEPSAPPQGQAPRGPWSGGFGGGQGGAAGQGPSVAPAPLPPSAPPLQFGRRAQRGGGFGSQPVAPAPQAEPPLAPEAREAPEAPEAAPTPRVRRWRLFEVPDEAPAPRPRRSRIYEVPAPSAPGVPGALPPSEPVPAPEAAPSPMPSPAPPAPRARVRWRRVPGGAPAAPESSAPRPHAPRGEGSDPFGAPPSGEAPQAPPPAPEAPFAPPPAGAPPHAA